MVHSHALLPTVVWVFRTVVARDRLPQGWNYKLEPEVDMPLEIVDDILKDFVEFPLSDCLPTTMRMRRFRGNLQRVEADSCGLRRQPFTLALSHNTRPSSVIVVQCWSGTFRSNWPMFVIKRIQPGVNIDLQLRMHGCTGLR